MAEEKRKMTNLQALRSLIEPYSMSRTALEFYLMQVGLEPDDEYTVSNTRIYSAAAKALTKFKAVLKEKDPATENAYDVEKLDEQIRGYQRQDPEEEEGDEYDFIDRTDEW